MNFRSAAILAIALIAAATRFWPAAGSREIAAPPAPIVAGGHASVDAVPPSRRQHPLHVLPSFTVVPGRDEVIAARGEADASSPVLDAAVDRAALFAAPVGVALPRARLGNPFYDFRRGHRGFPAQ
jgi:hypothetical protein